MLYILITTVVLVHILIPTVVLVHILIPTVVLVHILIPTVVLVHIRIFCYSKLKNVIFRKYYCKHLQHLNRQFKI